MLLVYKHVAVLVLAKSPVLKLQFYFCKKFVRVHCVHSRGNDLDATLHYIRFTLPSPQGSYDLHNFVWALQHVVSK